jgi:hypothetical protein
VQAPSRGSLNKSKNVPEIMATVCKHPRVRVVSRHEDMEFVECLECGEVFDSDEFQDMAIEESVEAEEADAES